MSQGNVLWAFQKYHTVENSTAITFLAVVFSNYLKFTIVRATPVKPFGRYYCPCFIDDCLPEPAQHETVLFRVCEQQYLA